MTESYSELQKRSVTPNELRAIMRVLDLMEAANLDSVQDGSIKVADEAGEPIAEVWWDGTEEMWLAAIPPQGDTISEYQKRVGPLAATPRNPGLM